MNSISKFLALLAAATTVSIAQSQVTWSGNGHAYELVTAKKNWANAKADAMSRTYGGAQGYLVTITSAEEQAFLVSTFGEGLREAWTGGRSTATGWSWMTGEPFTYSNWAPGEPNGGSNTINFHGANALGTWNDVPDAEVVDYIVEYSPDVAPWPMDRQDRWGTGRAIVGPAPATLGTPYLYRLMSVAKTASHPVALGPNGVGYYGSWVDLLLHRIQYQTGDETGTYNFSTQYPQSTPAISANGSAVYLHTAQYGTPAKLYKVNAGTMGLEWTFNTDSIKFSDFESQSPVIGPDGDVVISSSTGNAWRIDDVTGVAVWTKTTLAGGYRNMVFSRDDSKVYVANGNNLTALNYSDGTQAWTVAAGSFVGSPAVAPNGNVVFGTASGVVYALSPDTGGTVWTSTLPEKVTGAPAFATDGTVYVNSWDNNLYALTSSDGTEQWHFSTGDDLRQCPSVDTLGRIYVYNRLGRLYCVNANGSQAWLFQMPGGARGGISIGPDGMLYMSYSLEVGNQSSGVAMVALKIIKVQSLSLAETTVNGGQSTNATVTISENAPMAGFEVAVTTNSSAIIVPASTLITANSNTGSFTVGTKNVSTTVTRTVSASAGGVTKTAFLTIVPSIALTNLSVNPSTVEGGSPTTGQVSLNFAAPAGGIVVSLFSSSSSITVPGSVTVPEGSSSETFGITTKAVQSTSTRQISAQYNGITKTANITLTVSQGVIGLSFNPASLESGGDTTGTVVLGASAPTGGAEVTLTDNSTVLDTPASVTVNQGNTTAAFTVQTAKVAVTTTRSVTATYGGSSRTANITLTPFVVINSLTFNPSTFRGGNWTTGTVTLNFAAGVGGILIDITSGSSALYTPTDMTIPEDANSGSFPVISAKVTSTVNRTVTVTYRASQKTTTVTITP